jgi:hypothetical protein
MYSIHDLKISIYGFTKNYEKICFCNFMAYSLVCIYSIILLIIQQKIYEIYTKIYVNILVKEKNFLREN